MKKNQQSLQNKFAVTFLVIFGIHLAIAGIFVGSSAYGKSTENDAVYVGIDEQLKSPIAPPAVSAPDNSQHPAEQSNISNVSANTTTNVQQKPATIATNSSHSEPSPQSVPANFAKLDQAKKSTYTKTYTVKSGDTVFSISKKYKLNVNSLLKINNIKDPNKITVGQVLNFVSPSKK